MVWPRGRPTWNYGLTKDTDPRVKGAWNRGLTKETDIRVANYGRKKSGQSIPQERRDRISANLKGRFAGENSPNFGVPRTKETKRKLSLARKGKRLTPRVRLSISLGHKGKGIGKDNPMFGKKHTEEYKRQSSELHKLIYLNRPELRVVISQSSRASNALHPERQEKKSKRMKELWKDENYSKKVMTNWRKACQKEPNKSEVKLQELLDNACPKEYYYTGDGKLVIGKLCPDFCHMSKSKLVELFGAYWHKSSEVSSRTRRYREHGYDCLIIWDYELSDKDIREIVIRDIRSFTQF